ncbi:protein EVI2B [Vombatus ursinus]|uniref:Ecotropic viral integration site 2B n=1 Tax=Vombatus ursinus TaxID=29139 RepID=A0A4X2KRH5_VOMUR|nr:protein EVI2B [Vombatus ursinus]XP_027718391.1 protein EVI2B [Vombatus ursinus]
MDPKHFILMLFCGYLTNTSLTETQAYSTVSPQTTPFKSSISDTSANFGNGTENPLSQPLQLINTPSGLPPPSPTSQTSGQPPISPVPGSSGQLPASAVLTSSGQPPLSSIPKSSGQTPVSPVPKPSSQPIASLVFNSTRQPPESPTHNSSSQSPGPPALNSSSQSPASSVPNSTRQSPASSGPSSTRQPPVTTVHSSSKKPPASSFGPSSTRQSASTVVTPEFYEEKNNNPPQTKPQSSTANSIAGVLIGTILTSMIVTIFMIVLWKCFRKPILNDQNWAGRSPFADGVTPDMSMDYSTENGKSIKRSSIVSLEIWKPNKSMLLADDLDVKLFDSSENLDECPKSDVEKMKDHPNGTSDESADGSTVGTAISSSEETEVTPAPPLLDLDGPENQKPDSSNSLENDFSHLPPPLDCLDSAGGQPIPPLSDPSQLPPPPEALLKDQEEYSSEVQNAASPALQTQCPTPDDSSQQALDESLPPPPAELS